MAKRVLRLFAKEALRASLADKVVPGWPKVPWIRKPFSFACLGVRLTRARPGPSRKLIWPSGSTHSERPYSDSGEEVALVIGLEIIGVYVLDRAFIDIARRDVPGGDEVAQPLGGVGVVFVVVGGH